MEGGNNYKDFTDLEIWQLSHELSLKIKILIKYLPPEEKYNVSSQIIRSACSVSANIAEGHGRYHFQENIQFCRQARGSLDETRSHLQYIKDAKLIKKISSVDHLIELCKIIKAKLNGYIAFLNKLKHK